MFRNIDSNLLLYLVHPTGPYLRNQDLGTWTIPNGEIRPDEIVLHSACRRFTEEVGLPAFGPFIPLRPALQRSGNVVHGWAFEATSESMTIPAGYRAEWFTPQAARFRIDPALSCWIDEILSHVRVRS